MRDSFTINVLAINTSVPTFDGLFRAYSSSSNSSMLVDGNTAPVVDTVSVQIPAGVFMTVAALSNSSIRLSIVRIETSTRFLYPDDTTRNFEIAVILAVNFEGVTLEKLSSSDQILITFEKADVYCCIYRLVIWWEHASLAVLCVSIL